MEEHRDLPKKHDVVTLTKKGHRSTVFEPSNSESIIPIKGYENRCLTSDEYLCPQQDNNVSRLKYT